MKQYTTSQILFALIKIRQFALARELFDEMLGTGVRVDEYIYTAGMRAYCETNNLDGARGLLARMESKGIKSSAVPYNVLMYGFCLILFMRQWR